jgi:alkyl hydroperoxide reductase subunit D
MAMSNLYYRFVHLSEQPELSQLPAGLRMQGMMNPGTDPITFEMMCLGVSIVNGCGACISAHTQQLKEHGLPIQALARLGKIAAVLHAVHVSLGMVSPVAV